jgi:hypothetical protein
LSVAYFIQQMNDFKDGNRRARIHGRRIPMPWRRSPRR